MLRSHVSFEPWEEECRSEGYRFVAGVDEVGRGCIAGPVVAAAVIFPVDCRIAKVADSKTLSPQMRARLFPEIINQCVAFGVGFVSTDIIDRINILQASLLAMQRAILQLRAPLSVGKSWFTPASIT